MSLLENENENESLLQRRGRVRRLRSVSALPALLTLGNMLCGFAAIYFCVVAIFDFVGVGPEPARAVTSRAIFEKFMPTVLSVAGFLIFLGMLFDAMDGRVARMTSGTTSFGGQLDSLADMVTFGVAPAILMISLVTITTHLAEVDPDEAARRGANLSLLIVSTREAWVAGAIFASCAAVRLARYNVEHAETFAATPAFHGLPSPAAAAVVASLVILYEHVKELRGVMLLNFLPLVTIAAGLLMVSRLKYLHVANRFLRGRQPIEYLIAVIVFFGLLLWFPAQTMAVTCCAYGLTGPIAWAYKRYRGGARRQPIAAAEPSARPAEEENDNSESNRDSA